MFTVEIITKRWAYLWERGCAWGVGQGNVDCTALPPLGINGLLGLAISGSNRTDPYASFEISLWMCVLPQGNGIPLGKVIPVTKDNFEVLKAGGCIFIVLIAAGSQNVP